MATLLEKAQATFDNLETDHFTNLMNYLHELTEHARAGKLNESELTDLGFMTREIAKVYDELRKKVNRTHEQVNRFLCMAVFESFAQGDRPDLKCAGTLATGSAEMKTLLRVPKPTDEIAADYLAFMEMDASWTDPRLRYSFSETQKKMEGLSEDDLPASLRDCTYPQPHVRYRRRTK